MIFALWLCDSMILQVFFNDYLFIVSIYVNGNISDIEFGWAVFTSFHFNFPCKSNMLILKWMHFQVYIHKSYRY